MDLKDFREEVYQCRFTKCHRNDDKLPIIFSRNSESLSKIKLVIMSQEPSNSLLTNFTSRYEIEAYLRSSCQTGGGNLPRKMATILGQTFDPVCDEIYWTHALKCIPQMSNKQIQIDWPFCASHCVNHFKHELRLLPVKSLAIVTLGTYALTMCQSILEGKPITDLERITSYFISYDLEQEFHFEEKRIQLFAFIHPSYEEVHLKRLGKKGQQKRDESIKKIHEIIQT